MSNRNIFQISDSMMNLLECSVDDTTGEIPQTEEEFALMYDKIELELTTKIDNTNSMVKSLLGDVDVIDKEIKRLEALKKSNTQLSKWLANRVDMVLRQQNTDEFGELNVDKLKEMVKNINKQLTHSAISYRKSESVEITDADKLPKEYKTIVVEEKPNKIKLKEYLETQPNKECKFARMKPNISMTIK